MSYTYDATDLSSDLAKLRLAIGDTTEDAGVRPDGGNFSDEELQVFLDGLGVSQTWRNAVPAALRVLANQYSAAAKKTDDAEISEDLTQTAKALREQAREFEASITATGSDAGGGFSAGVVTFGSFVYEVQSDGAVV